jgi:hypothetical protein
VALALAAAHTCRALLSGVTVTVTVTVRGPPESSAPSPPASSSGATGRPGATGPEGPTRSVPGPLVNFNRRLERCDNLIYQTHWQVKQEHTVVRIETHYYFSLANPGGGSPTEN